MIVIAGADLRAQPPRHLERARPQRRARQAAGADRRDLGRRRAQAVAGDGGVGGDHAVEVELHRQRADGVDVGVGQVGRDLHQQRHPARRRRGVRGGPHRPQDLAEPLHGLQIAQARRVGRAHVHHQVVGQRREQGRARDVVCGGVDVGRGLVLADVHADDARPATPPPRAQAGSHRVGAAVVEAQPVDERSIVDQPEHPRLRVARLRPRRDGADLDEAEAEREQRVDAARVLVEAGGQADGRRELEPERVDPRRRRRHAAHDAQQRRAPR
jgi:hypothetical protein